MMHVKSKLSVDVVGPKTLLANYARCLEGQGKGRRGVLLNTIKSFLVSYLKSLAELKRVQKNSRGFFCWLKNCKKLDTLKSQVQSARSLLDRWILTTVYSRFIGV